MTARRPEPTSGPGQPACSIDVDGWGWRHGGRIAWALDDVDLHVRPGERVLVLGPSGSGKSTLMSGLAGLLGGSDEGEAHGSLLIDTKIPVDLRGRIGLVMQDPEAQVVLARAGDDVAFGMENLGVARDDIWPRVDAALDGVGLNIERAHSTSRLSGGQKQRLALASVLAMNPGLLLLDEPTANLDPEGVREVREAVERVLEKTCATLVVIEHRVDVWADLVDRVVIILDGRVAADGPIADVLTAEADTLRERGIWLPADDVASFLDPLDPLPVSEATCKPSIIETKNLSIGYSDDHLVRSGIDLSIPRGSSTCIIGSNGVGKTTLALTLAGLLPHISGDIAMESAAGLPNGSADPHDWKSAELLGRISMVFQEPEYQFIARTVREELEIGPKKSGIDGQELETLVDEHLDALGLTKLAHANPMTLSGGEKRRLSVATALISASELLILDEPTFGQDRRTWLELVRLLRRARTRGTTLVSVTHDPAFIAAMGENLINLDELGEPGNGPSRGQAAQPDPHANGDVHQTSSESKKVGGLEAVRSFFADVNPVTNFLALIFMTAPLLASIDVVTASLALVLECGLIVIQRMNLRSLLVRMIPLLLGAPVAALSMLLYAKPGGEIYWSFGPATVSERSTWLALAIFLRIIAIALPAIILMWKIDPTDMADGLAQILHMPARPVIATLAAARMAGLMAADWKGLEEARRIRGIGDAHRIVSAARGSFALLVFALRRAAKLALTMEARGFGAPGPRTWARESRIGPPDAVMLIISILIPVTALTTAIVTGNFELVG